jgi:exopolysaccharide biosynthesis polyprenyl glycosylphosphotransferase
MSSVFALALLLGDFIAVIGAFTGAYILRVSLSDAPFIAITSGEYVRLFLLLTPIWLLIFAGLGLYSYNIYEWRLKEFGRLLIGSGLGIMAMITYEFIINRPIFPARIVAVYALAIGYLLLIFERTLLRALRLIARRRGVGIVNTLIIGDSPYAHELIEAARKPERIGYRVSGVVMNSPPADYKGRVYASLETALANIERKGIHSIVLTELFTDQSKNELVLAASQRHHCGFRFIPTQGSMYSGAMEVELFHGTPMIHVHQTPLYGSGRIIKRIFDLVVGSILLVLVSPVILLFIIILAVFDHGAPIYKPKRLTRYNEQVRIYKLRTIKHAYNNMSPEEGFEKLGRPELSKPFRENGDQLENDPRFGRLGMFMRKTSIDELPQLLNVVRGDISLVGPRPLSAFELEGHPNKDTMLSVKTGVTGLAVISGRKDLPFEERRKLDVYYVQNWSLWLDIKILLRTVTEVLRSRGTA